jgi:RNA polymerase sigma-70 factor (ECF subfamily)
LCSIEKQTLRFKNIENLLPSLHTKTDLTTISNDKELVESLQRGDADAFDKLFGKYSSRLYAFGIKYLRSKEDAEGLVQGVFLKIWENRKKLKNESSFQSYIFTIAYNDMCNIFRKRVSMRQYHDNVSRELTEAMQNTDDRADFKSVLEQVDRLIELLPDQQKTVFLKSRKEGLSTKEIARELNLSPGTVDNYISSALKFLRVKLGSDNLAMLLFVSLWVY